MLLLQSLTNLSLMKRTCKARADVIENTPQQPLMLKCLATFVPSMHLNKLAYTLISIEIASV